jgi:hypothetical protein
LNGNAAIGQKENEKPCEYRIFDLKYQSDPQDCHNFVTLVIGPIG